MRRWSAFALLLLMFCGACGLPIPSGTTVVRKVSGPQPADETDPVKRIPPPPFPGEAPQAILKGFLAAGNEPDVAREYLTAANAWIPTESTTVFTGDPVVTTSPLAAGGLAASASITPILLINSDGSTQVPGTAPLKFTLKQENGQWRIAVLPNGTALEQSDLASSFRRGVLGWLSPDHRSLVRQSVLVPDPESLIPNLVSALIGGPSNLLASAGVASVVPGRWTADPPTLNGTELLVGLHTNGAAVAATDLPALRAQFAATLLSAEIMSIVVTVNGQPLLGGTTTAAPITVADEANFDRDLVDSAGIATTSYLATAGGIAPLVLPGPFATAAPRPTAKATSKPLAPVTSPSNRATSSTRATPTRASPSPSARATSSSSLSTTQESVFNPGVPISAFAVSAEGQRFAELRDVGPHLQQPVQINLGSSVAQPLGPARDYLSLAWGADDTLWLTTRAGAVFMALRDHAPQPIQASTPLNDLVIAPDGVDAVGISTTGTLVTALVSDGADGSTSGLTNEVQLAPSLKGVTAVAVVGTGVGGLSLLVAATQTANLLVPGSAGPPVVGLWQVSTGAPDPTDATPEALSESVAPVNTSPCVGGLHISGLVARPGAIDLAECSDFSLEAFDQRRGPLYQQWLRVSAGLAGYPLG